MPSRKYMTNLSHRNGERGAVLAIGLVVLLALTLIGTSSINSVRLDERMTMNAQNRSMAFQGAEAGLIQCETDIQVATADLLSAQYSLNEFAGDTGSGSSGGATTRWWDDPAFWDDKRSRLSAVESFASTDTLGLAEEPACVIEYVGSATPSLEFSEAVATLSTASKNVYRITAFSYGANKKTYAVVEGIYAH